MLDSDSSNENSFDEDEALVIKEAEEASNKGQLNDKSYQHLTFDVTLLMYSAMNRYEKAVRRILDLKADPNIKEDEDGITALWFSICCGPQKPSVDLAKMLLEANADPNVACYEGEVTPLMNAVRFNSVDAVNLLRKHGAKLEPTDEDGKTALMIAKENGFEDIVKILEDHETKN